MECRITLRLRRKKVQEVPLRHQGDEFATRRQMRKVGACDLLIVEHYLHPAQFLMRQAQELIEHPQLMHQLQRGRMYGVAAKVAEEVSVFFKDHHLNAGAGEQQPKHHTGWAATDNTTGGSDLLRALLGLTHSQCCYIPQLKTGVYLSSP